MINLKEFYPELIESTILVLVLMLLRLILKRTVRNFAKKIERLEHRTGLIMKHVNFAIFFLLVFGFILIWGVDFRNLGVVMSSVFAVIGIAFFAQWSILSNITSGVIMFFTFPYKIGDYIKIHDKEMPCEGIIEDIKTFHIILHTTTNEIITYPNSMMLQKGVSIIKPEEFYEQQHELDKNKEKLTHD
ncbi:small-conductance mechanosensitive channel [Aequorivita sublithincola DSM 14238]|uniref:Small-conductance mechanosensitive channel n=1 Tax=Aequorivita sublithincola (strain DSM 14238 / LMG 21431 / ACAM 643 / 9-3) TaxID=746697 RepID=I3YZK4_AEQSU|nr:mechanosensitive ion channel domain-containing protein [Aequorivita sublithincola]AFL82422.1 small-conductance mechanosensitive channel [Aequorivita sublithincola DSM 14238]